MSGSRGRSGGLPGSCGGGSGPNSWHALPGVCAIVDGDGPPTACTPLSPRQAAATMLFSSSGFGVMHNAHFSDGADSVPDGDTTSAV